MSPSVSYCLPLSTTRLSLLPNPHPEAVNAYDALSLYGAEMMGVFTADGDTDKAEVARNVRDTGRMMLVTEITAAKSYWQVCDGDCGAGTQRIYPPAFSPKVVGQIWSDSAQMQTWFGSSWWKVRSWDGFAVGARLC